MEPKNDKLIQLHWQFKDGTTEMRAQREVSSPEEERAFMEEMNEDRPLPEGVIWRFVPEGAKEFVMTHAENRI